MPEIAKTEHLKLNQWEPEDQVLRTDFNADNQKIDAAFAAVPLVKLKEVVTQQDAQQVDVDVSDIDFDAYDEVIVYTELKNTIDDGNASPYCSITINGDTTQKYGCASNDTMSGSSPMQSTYILYPGIISSKEGNYYTCGLTKIRFQKQRGCLFARCDYGYMQQKSSYYFRSSAGLYHMGEDTSFTTFSITANSNGNNFIATGSRLHIMGVKR